MFCIQSEQGNTLQTKAYSKTLTSFVSLAVWHPMGWDKWQLYFSIGETQNAQKVLDFIE